MTIPFTQSKRLQTNTQVQKTVAMAKFVLLMAYLCTPATVVKAAAPCSLAFQNFIPTFGASPTKGTIAIEDELIAEVSSGQDRLANSEKVFSLVTQLEQSGKSIARPAIGCAAGHGAMEAATDYKHGYI
jgi:hypothetical protein